MKSVNVDRKMVVDAALRKLTKSEKKQMPRPEQATITIQRFDMTVKIPCTHGYVEKLVSFSDLGI